MHRRDFLRAAALTGLGSAELYELDPSGYTSHPVGAGTMTVNGHNTYLPRRGNEWVVNDTYPQGRARMLTLYLYHIRSDRAVVLGHFGSPAEYVGEYRCDLHPRSSRDGRQVCIDSTHGGHGRQMYPVVVSDLT